MNDIVLIAGSSKTKDYLVNQLKEYIPKEFNIIGYSLDEGIPKNIRSCLIIISSSIAEKELMEATKIDSHIPRIVCLRTLNTDNIIKVINIPKDTEVLYVNDVKEATYRGIETMKEFGLDHIRYYPYYPGIDDYHKCKIAITPGEVDKVPSYIEKIIDLGPRIIDFVSLLEIINAIGLNNNEAGLFTKKYIKKIINISKKIAEANSEVITMNNYLNNIIDGLGSGILVYDSLGYIKYMNEEMKKFFHIQSDDIVGKNVHNHLIEKKIIEYILTEKNYENKTFICDGINYKLNKFNIPNSSNIIFTSSIEDNSEEKRRLRNELILKGHYAKYSFKDIIGNSKAIIRVINTAKKLAKSDLTILIEGESGTGKELLASAIHRHSKRKEGPFLAVNFSALSDNLIESELFGYEEGAFTGAKKGGKIGLFELADGGTIFLDEIGDISPKVQTRLLRVLQEKEIMPIGSTRIKKVDVRIIAATNKNLTKMVKENKFRSDLYYRFKIGYIYIPALRHRLEDIDELVNKFIISETIEKVEIANSVLEEFKKFKWFGNIRELQNTIKYMNAVKVGKKITLTELPNKRFFEEKDMIYNINEEYKEINEELLFILNKIKELSEKGLLIGRERISQELQNTIYPLSRYQVRNRLDTLEKLGYITKGKGKKGTEITYKGIEYLNKSNGDH